MAAEKMSAEWNSPKDIKDLLSRNRLKMNWEDYSKLYNMQVRCKPMWEGETLSNEEVAKLTNLDKVRVELHSKVTDDIIKDNDLTNGVYESVRRGIALMMEEDYQLSRQNKLEGRRMYEKRN